MRQAIIFSVGVMLNGLGYAAYRGLTADEPPPTAVVVVEQPQVPQAGADTPKATPSEEPGDSPGTATDETDERTHIRKPRKRRRRATRNNRPTKPTADSDGREEEEEPVEDALEEPELARIDILSTPKGAAVTIDGVPRGRTPVVGLQVRPDEKTRIVLTHEAHRAWETTLVPVPGFNPTVVAELDPIAPKKAAVSKVPPPPTKKPGLRVARDVVGSAEQGAALVGRCNQCHSKTAPKLSARRYTLEQWSRYFAYARHERHSPLGDVVSGAELADIKAHLQESAADQARGTAAGVR